MHELPLTQNILEIALKHGEKENASRILSLHIVIGELTSFIDDSIQFYWEIIAKDTIAEGASLVFDRRMAEIKCNECNIVFPLPESRFTCPECGSGDISITKGKEFFLNSIDIE